MELAFIGMGNMGSGMARNLLRAGHSVTVYNRDRAKAEPLAADGAHIADSVAGAVRNADAVLTMLADDHAVEQVVLGEDGAASVMKRDAVHISHSTISTALARRLTTGHEARGQGFLSAPVFGRPEAAAAKKLIVVPAGPPALVEQFGPLFEALGRKTFVAGSEPWQANAVKLCGNFMIASMLETFGEAFATLRKAGVQPQLFLEVMNELFGSPVYAGYGSAIVADRFEPAGFVLRLGLKDVRLVLQTAEECSSPMPIASLIRDQLLSAMAHGQAELDWSSVARVAAKNAGL